MPDQDHSPGYVPQPNFSGHDFGDGLKVPLAQAAPQRRPRLQPEQNGTRDLITESPARSLAIVHSHHRLALRTR